MKNIKITKRIAHCSNFTLQYEHFFKDRHYHTLSEGFKAKENIHFSDRTKQGSINKMEKWFSTIILNNETQLYSEHGHYIDCHLPNMMKSTRSDLVAYHISSIDNHKSIMCNGLTPQGNPNIEVDLASITADSAKPHWIPKNILRSKSLYFYPSLENHHFSVKRKNEVLYAVKLKNPENYWVGSQGLGGFLLFDEERLHDESYMNAHRLKILEEEVPDYWRYSCSLNDYLRNSSHVRKKDKYAGLDEILCADSYKPNEVSYLGYWDSNSIFHTEPAFASFTDSVLDYKYIIQEYEKVKY